jgi:hypothetical protein
MKRILTVVALGLTLSGCAYNAPVAVTPNLDVYSSYGAKLPGSYLLYIDDDTFSQTIKATGYSCSAHTYPLDVRAAFRDSAVKTIDQLVENVQVVTEPVPASALASQGKAGMIIIRSDTLQARFVAAPGFWSATIDANVDLAASVTVDGVQGRLLGTTAEGSGNAQSDAGAMCGGAADAIGHATEKAIKQLLGQIGERLSNSERLRSAMASKP